MKCIKNRHITANIPKYLKEAFKVYCLKYECFHKDGFRKLLDKFINDLSLNAVEKFNLNCYPVDYERFLELCGSKSYSDFLSYIILKYAVSDIDNDDFYYYMYSSKYDKMKVDQLKNVKETLEKELQMCNSELKHRYDK